MLTALAIGMESDVDRNVFDSKGLIRSLRARKEKSLAKARPREASQYCIDLRDR